LVFAFRQDPAYWNLDDISVRDASYSANGTLSFTDLDRADTHSASFDALNGGAGYIGSFAVNGVSENSGAVSVGWTFQVDPVVVDGLANAVTQSYKLAIDDHAGGTASEPVSISIATSHSDTFSFTPGLGADVFFNFGTASGNADRIQLSGFAALPNAAALDSHVHANSAGEGVLDLGAGDSITFAGISEAQLHAHVHDWVMA
jgi:hypothetical protein